MKDLLICDLNGNKIHFFIMKCAKLVPELLVSDLRKSHDFYVGVVGFTIKYQREAERFMYLEQGGAEIMLEEINAQRRMWKTDSLEYPLGRGINFQIEVKDVDALYLKVCEQKIELFTTIEEKEYKRDNDTVFVKQFLVQDPDGYLLRFFSYL